MLAGRIFCAQPFFPIAFSRVNHKLQFSHFHLPPYHNLFIMRQWLKGISSFPKVKGDCPKFAPNLLLTELLILRVNFTVFNYMVLQWFTRINFSLHKKLAFFKWASGILKVDWRDARSTQKFGFPLHTFLLVNIFLNILLQSRWKVSKSWRHLNSSYIKF